jgi:hypothetical protein
MAVLDHLVFAVSDLDAGRRWLRDATGVAPAIGGAHPGRGTHNALASVGSAYVELIARDPEQPDPDGPLPFGLDGFDGDGLVAFAVRPDDGESIDDIVGRARAGGYDPGQVLSMSRRRPDGFELNWRNTLPPAVAGGVVPFLIDWGSTDMPSATAPGGLELTSFGMRHPEPDAIRAAHEAMGFAVDVGADESAGLFATLRGTAGTVSLRAAVNTPD